MCVCVGEFEVREANVENKSANSDLSRRRRRKHCPRGGFYYYGGVAHPLTKSTVDGLFIEYETGNFEVFFLFEESTFRPTSYLRSSSGSVSFSYREENHLKNT